MLLIVGAKKTANCAFAQSPFFLVEQIKDEIPQILETFFI